MKPGQEVWGYRYGDPDRIELWFGAFETREECVREALASRSDSTRAVWVHRGRALNPISYMPSAETILEWANDCNGEVSLDDDPFEVTEQAAKELDELLQAWTLRHIDEVSVWTCVGEPELVAEPEQGEG